jgi:diaminohydroxyphosphoribosylaminopyrimidine deaminase/5-amino-6-(5-phosphoribosylamino)uracil reductase
MQHCLAVSGRGIVPLPMLSETLAWRAILALDRLLAQRVPGAGAVPGERFLVTPDAATSLPESETPPAGDTLPAGPALPALIVQASIEAGPWVQAEPEPAPRHWQAAGPVDADAARVLDLYLPMVLAPMRARPQVIAHLAQSLDGRIATSSGTSQWISGALDQMHNHRMRALCDAVLVGAETIIHDDPQLTCREVEGTHPVRVVVDPRGRVSMDRRVFKDDAAPTVIITGEAAAGAADPALPAHVSRMEIVGMRERISPQAILDALWSMNVRRVFVEGGGVTVSSFLRERLLDRLQITVAPVIIGSGRASISLPEIDSLEHALRPRMRRFTFGPDVLFECMFEV